VDELTGSYESPPEIPEGTKPNCGMCGEHIEEQDRVSCHGTYYHFQRGSSYYGGDCYDQHLQDGLHDED